MLKRAGCPIRVIEVDFPPGVVGFRWREDAHPPLTVRWNSRFRDQEEDAALLARLQAAPVFRQPYEQPECWLLHRRPDNAADDEARLATVAAALRAVVAPAICLHSCDPGRVDRAVRNIALANAISCRRAGRSNVAFAVELSTFTDWQLPAATALLAELQADGALALADGEPLPSEAQVIVLFAENDRAWQQIVRRRAREGEFAGKWPILVTCESQVDEGRRSATLAEISDLLLDHGAVTVTGFHCRPHVPSFPRLGRCLSRIVWEAVEFGIDIDPDELLHGALEMAKHLDATDASGPDGN